MQTIRFFLIKEEIEELKAKDYDAKMMLENMKQLHATLETK